MVTSGTCPPVYSNEVEVLVNPLPVPTITGPATACLNSTGNIYSTEGGMLSWTWSVSGGGLITAGAGTNSITVTWNTVGAQSVSVNYVNTNTCTATAPTVKAVTIDPMTVISVQPVSVPACEFGTVNFSTTATGSNLTYQWLVDKNTGTFVPVPGGWPYSGETTSTLQILSTVRTMNNYKYHVVVSGCPPAVTSTDAILTVNTAPELTVHPVDVSLCLGANGTLKAATKGTSVTWQWEVNTGSGFGPLTLDANFSVVTTIIPDTTKTTLTITNAQASFNNWIFRAVATGICGTGVNTNFARLTVTTPPAVTIQPANTAICENANTSFIGNGSGYTGMKWQVSTNGGGSWTDISLSDPQYLGAGTNQLSILNTPVSLNGNKYSLALIGACTTINTNAVTLTVNPNPVVAFAADINACGGIPVVIDGNPTGGTGPYTHLWTGDVGPLNNYVVQSPTFKSLITGTYNLNYKATDSKGCTANDNVAVIVDSPSADFNQDVNNGCTPLSVKFTKDMTGLSRFWWDFNDGSPVDSVTTGPVHEFTNTNATSIEYLNVKLTVQSPGGCLDTFTSLVTAYPEIDAAFTANDSIICSGNPIVFTSVPGASKYYWDYGDGANGYAINTTSHTYTNFTAAPVVLKVKLTTTSFYSCSDVKTVNITVMPVPLPQFTAIPVNQVYSTAGNPVTFTNTTNEGTWNWLWKFGDGTTSSDKNPSHTYTALGNYTVTLLVSNANCSDSIQHQVSVTPLPPVANFDPIPSGCEPLDITISNTSLNTDTPGTTYRWDFGDGSISTAKNPVYTFFDPGTYRVELTVTGPGGISTFSQVVNSYSSPRANFEVSPTVVFVNDEKVRGFNLSEHADSYLWEWGDGDTSKTKEPFHKYMEAGDYDVTLWAYSDNGCSDKYVLSPAVKVTPAGEVRFSTVFTPNLDGPIDRTDLPTGGTEIDQFFFPPIREKVLDYKLQIFNRLGVLIFQSHDINVPWNGYYKGNLCPQGVYIWYVEGKYANGQPFKKVGDVTLLH
jgi:PKD repeat protein